MAFCLLFVLLFCTMMPGGVACASGDGTDRMTASASLPGMSADDLESMAEDMQDGTLDDEHKLTDTLDAIDEARENGTDQEEEAWEVDLTYKNAQNGKLLVVEDGAGLFSDAEIRQFIESASGVLEYANVYIVTAKEENYEGLAKRLIDETFGNGSDSTLFMINMEPRRLYLFSEGNTQKVLTKDKARTITDNIYRQASLGAYYACAQKALRQEATLLSGGRILEPMKYIGDFFLAFMVAILLVFGMTFWMRPKEKREVVAGIDEAVLAAIAAGIAFSFSREEKIYDPPSSNDSSSGGGGGFSGGGDSGSGGGHSF